MNIYVCIKQVPDTNLTLRVDADGLRIQEDGVEYVTSPYDEHAIEAALQLKEQHGGEVTAITMGPERAQKVLRDALARSCDKAVHIDNPALVSSDCVATARVLAGYLKDKEYDIVLCGKQAADDDSAAVGQALGEFLSVAHVAEIEKLETEDGKTLTVHRAVDGGTVIVECSVPAVLTAQKSLNTPRYPSLKGIMKAKRKPIEKVTLADVQLSAGQVGSDGSPTKLGKLETAPEKSVSPRVIEGETADAVAELARLLREEAKVI